MCGIAGILAGRGAPEAELLRRMAASITHRGPDDEGVWIDAKAGIGFGHRRLAIVDLSPQGHQPMASQCGRYILSYNGEIYNHARLRAELGDCTNWRGHSDTETLLECIAAWGLEAALRKCVGMFALSLWDNKQRTLKLARDRFGEKPLYYGWTGGDFVFASEMKAIRQHPRFDNAISRRALGIYASRTYIPAPLSIYERLFKLQPGCILSVTRAAAISPRSEPAEEGRSERGLSLKRYWSYREVMRRGLADPIEDEIEALERLDQALSEAIKGQSVADVPVGAFLSSGVDSSTIVALYQKYSSNPVRTFTIGFEEAGYNEADHAKAVAQHLGTVHSERYVTVKEARDVIPTLPAMYDEPFADSSQIPTHLVSRFAREQVKVALSGDGGDELFAGYNRHVMAPDLWRRLRMLPRAVRALAGPPLSKLPPALWNAAPGAHAPNFGAKVQKALRIAGGARTFDEVYESFLDEWALEPSPVLGARKTDNRFDMDLAVGAPDTLRMMYCDAVTYLPDDILCKVDRASMAVSLESRVPFLDHRVAELASRIPLSMKIRDGQGKYILRKLLHRQAPAALFDRPKAGFGIPVGEWIKGPLRPWAEELLDRDRLSREGFFDANAVDRRWRQHLSGQRESAPAIWAVLMFQAWYAAN